MWPCKALYKNLHFSTFMPLMVVFRSLVLTFLSIAFSASQFITTERKNHFIPGEHLEYKLSYGWFSIGKASFLLEESIQKYEDEECYKVQVKGGSSGFLNAFASVDDEWGAYLKTSDLTPMMTYRNIKEGRYRLNEKVIINPDSGKIVVESVKLHKEVPIQPTRYYDYEPSRKVYDMLGGLLKVRNHDFERLSVNDTISVDAFFEDTFYDFKIVYEGKEKVKVKAGRYDAYKLLPIMPENSAFDGKKSIRCWLSADENRLPLKVTANMFIGKASCELTAFENVKSGK